MVGLDGLDGFIFWPLTLSENTQRRDAEPQKESWENGSGRNGGGSLATCFGRWVGCSSSNAPHPARSRTGNDPGRTRRVAAECPAANAGPAAGSLSNFQLVICNLQSGEQLRSESRLHFANYKLQICPGLPMPGGAVARKLANSARNWESSRSNCTPTGASLSFSAARASCSRARLV